MSEILKVFPEYVMGKTTWWVILDCGHWYHWTGEKAPKQSDEKFPCPTCALVHFIVTMD